jgi:hypothetical protein
MLLEIYSCSIIPKINFWFAFLLFSLQYFTISAQSAISPMGARANGMGYTSSCLKDEWSLLNNVGGLADIKNSSASFTYRAQPSFKSFNSMAAVVTVPTAVGVAGASIYKFGDNLYNEQILSIGFGSKFGLASLGVKGNFIQYYIEGFGYKRVSTISFGGVADLTPKVSVGASITNINQPKISENEHVPTLLTAGISIKLSENVLIATEVEKDLERKPLVKSGLEYSPQQKIYFRTGFNLNPQAGFFGLGFKAKKFMLDYAYQYKFSIGASHQASVTYKFKSK